MGGITTDRTSALLAVVACALVVCSALAVAPGQANAQEDVTGEATFDETNGKLTVEIDERDGVNGSFTGDSEEVTIDIGGSTVTPDSYTPGENESTYTYEIGPNELSELDSLDGQDGSDTTVTVSHGGSEVFNETEDIRQVVLGGTGSVTDDGSLRLDLAQDFGIGPDGSVPARVKVGDTSQNVTTTYQQDAASNESYLVLNRNTLSEVGVLRQPQEIEVSGQSQALYLQSAATIDIAAVTSVQGQRLSDGSGVQFDSARFEGGETYVVTVGLDSSAGQYVRTVDASEQAIEVESAALAAESNLTLTVEHASGTTVVDGNTVGFSTESVTGNLSGAVVTFDSLPNQVEGGNTEVWIHVEDGIERYSASFDAGNETLELSSVESLEWADGTNETELLVEQPEAPLHATVTLQSGSGGGGSGDSGSGGLGGLLGNTLVVIVGGSLLGVIIVAGGVYLALSVFGSGETQFNPFGGSSKSKSSNESPPAETATVSLEVVDELANRTYREANRVIARQKDSGQTGIGSSNGAVGNRNAGRSTGQNARRGGPAGVNTGNSESIDLSAGKGSTELNYGNWVFEVVEKSRTVGQREHPLEYGFDSDRIVLSVTPYTVDVQVTEGPERAPAKQAEVTVTADVEGWQRRKRTDPDGRVQLEIPRSASRVTFTAKTGTSQPVEADYRVDQAVQDGVGLAVGAETGDMGIETRVGERAWPGVDVRITPVSEDATAYTDEGTVNTDADGHRQVQNLPTGEYEVSAQPQLDGVETTAAVERVTVRNDATTNVTLSIGVSYSMPETYRDRLGDLRERIGELTSATNRDVAIPRYYGTVLTSVLDLVDAVESSPERVVEAGISPDATVEALLDATDAGITAVGGAMSERRNVKLFGAADSMPPAEVDWSGEATLNAFLDQVTEGGERDRRALRDRLEETDGVLDQKWGEVNEIAPARKLHDRVGELARETGGIDDELTVVARAYVGICLLDAIEELFEHDALEERLNSGSY